MTLNENIKQMRLQMGLNQVEFAKMIGVTKQCVSNWENDNIVPSIEMLVRLADFFSTTTDYLLGRDNKKLLVVDGLSSGELAHIKAIVSDILSAKKGR